MNTGTLSAVRPVAQFGEPQLHADGDLLALTFAPDGAVCSMEDSGVLRRWNAQTGQQLAWLALSDLETIWAFSRDARILASGSDDLTLWDAASGQVLTAFPSKTWVTAIAFAPDSGLVATGHDDGAIRFWDAPGHHLVHEWRFHDNAISALAVNGDGRLLAAAGEDKIISLWDLTAGKHLGVRKGHTDRIPALAWHPSEDFLVSAGWDTTARVWDVRTRAPVILLNSHSMQVTALAISPDGSRLACADSTPAIRVWDFTTKKLLHVLKAPSDIHCLAFSPDGKRLACSGDFLIHLWDVETGQNVAGAGPRSPAPTSLAVFPDGSRLVSNSGGGAARVWNLQTKQMQLSLPVDRPVHGVAVSGDSQVIAGALEKHLRIWEAATAKIRCDCDGPEAAITVVAASPDGKLFASASSAGTDVWLWRAQDGEPVLLIPDPLHNCTIESLAFSPDSRRLAVAGIDWLATGGSSGGTSVWDVSERCEIATFAGGAATVVFHPSGQRLASTSTEQTICLWDLASQELLVELAGHEGVVAGLAYSPDGQWLASGGEDRTLRLWNPDGEEVAIHEVDSQITALAFSPDGRFLFVAHANTTCSQYRLEELLK